MIGCIVDISKKMDETHGSDVGKVLDVLEVGEGDAGEEEAAGQDLEQRALVAVLEHEGGEDHDCDGRAGQHGVHDRHGGEAQRGEDQRQPDAAQDGHPGQGHVLGELPARFHSQRLQISTETCRLSEYHTAKQAGNNMNPRLRDHSAQWVGNLKKRCCKIPCLPNIIKIGQIIKP